MGPKMCSIDVWARGGMKSQSDGQRRPSESHFDAAQVAAMEVGLPMEVRAYLAARRGEDQGVRFLRAWLYLQATSEGGQAGWDKIFSDYNKKLMVVITLVVEGLVNDSDISGGRFAGALGFDYVMAYRRSHWFVRVAWLESLARGIKEKARARLNEEFYS
jgi:hypothetical protein